METTGGVLTPGPSGLLQADLLLPLKMPAVLVSDRGSGGIGSTISAAESLLWRGYEIDAIVCFVNNPGIVKHAKNDYEMDEKAWNYLHGYFSKRGIYVAKIPWMHALQDIRARETDLIAKRYSTESKLPAISELAKKLEKQHKARILAVPSLTTGYEKAVWHRATHDESPQMNDTLILDSNYDIYHQDIHAPAVRTNVKSHKHSLFPSAVDSRSPEFLRSLGDSNPVISQAAAYSSGHYGHAMFAGSNHKPAFALAQHLLKNLENPCLDRWVFTKNGNTAVEVAIRMALLAVCKRYEEDKIPADIGVLGLRGSSHWKQMDSIDAADPSLYSGKFDRKRDYWFTCPTVRLNDGRWIVRRSLSMQIELRYRPNEIFNTLDGLFDFERRAAAYQQYKEHITNVLDWLVRKEYRRFGALIMQPIIQGSGDLSFVDPVYQRALVDTVRSYSFDDRANSAGRDPNDWRGLPVIFDEAETGLYNLGRFSSATPLKVYPDISVHTELPTGLLWPLSVTLTSKSIHDAFLSHGSTDTLLQENKDVAHPVGCHVARSGLEELMKLRLSESWKSFYNDWNDGRKDEAEIDTKRSLTDNATATGKQSPIWCMWSKQQVIRLSNHKYVDHVVAIGNTLAVSFKNVGHNGKSHHVHAAQTALKVNTTALLTSIDASKIHESLVISAMYSWIRVYYRAWPRTIYCKARLKVTPDETRMLCAKLIRQLNHLVEKKASQKQLLERLSSSTPKKEKS